MKNKKETNFPSERKTDRERESVSLCVNASRSVSLHVLETKNSMFTQPVRQASLVNMVDTVAA